MAISKRQNREIKLFHQGRLVQVGLVLDGLISSLDIISPPVVKALRAAKYEVNQATNRIRDELNPKAEGRGE